MGYKNEQLLLLQKFHVVFVFICFVQFMFVETMFLFSVHVFVETMSFVILCCKGKCIVYCFKV